MKHLIIHTDGSCRGNPGHCGIGVTIKDRQGREIEDLSEYIHDNQTNNYAEYMAVIKGVLRAKELGATDIDVFSDSKLVVEQAKNNYRVTKSHLQLLHAELMLTARGANVKYYWIPREKNKEADYLAGQAVTQYLKKKKEDNDKLKAATSHLHSPPKQQDTTVPIYINTIFKSNCHSAPIETGRVDSYYCTECGNPCRLTMINIL